MKKSGREAFPLLLNLLIVISLISVFLEASASKKGKEEVLPRQDVVLSLMQRTAGWQINNQEQSKHHDLSWINAAFYIGLKELSLISPDKSYGQWLSKLGWKYQWQPYYRIYVADDLAVSQMYLDMYREEGDKRMLEPTYARTEWVMNHPSVSSLLYDGRYLSLERWSWCDALFMAPPVYAQMYSITKDSKFLDFMDREYKMTYDLLYDHDEKLFYRDHNYFDLREKNGKKVFWGRGNGWVVGGLVKILKELPEYTYSRAFYERLLIEMCERIARLQDSDGYWHASLLDPESYPNPETSASSFFVYTLAYGINSGLLSKESYLPVVIKGWEALEEAVSPEGKLGWVQPVGASPGETSKEMTEAYGIGAFLLAGAEVYRLVEKMDNK